MKLKYQDAVFEAAYGTSEQLPAADEIEFAFAGRSNVGKSSLLNKIFGRKALARVSAQPGKTATVNFYDVGGIKFVDLPGYGYAKVALSEKKRWANLVEGYLMAERDIRLVVQLIDARHAPTEDDLHMVDFMVDNEMPFIIALTKCDKLNKTQRAERTAALIQEIPYSEEITTIFTSAETGEGIDELREIFNELAEDDE